MKNVKSLYGFGGHSLKISEVCMDFEPNFKVYNLISIYPKSIKLGHDQSQHDLSCGGVSLPIG